MPEEYGLAKILIDRIRSDSASVRLTSGTDLAPLAPEGESAEAALEAGAEPDIKTLRGSAERYYFSDRSMTDAYAKHLYRLAERDPVRLIADTTRDDSRVYPRPTPLSSFMDAPFSMTRSEIDAAASRMVFDPAYADIRATAASNGDRYLYSADFLDDARAVALAEWAAVGEKENP